MRKMLHKLTAKYGEHLCAFALLISGMACENCRFVLYQPKEPEGLAEFAARRNKISK